MNEFLKIDKPPTPFFLTIRVQPLPGNDQGEGVDKAIAKVWVFDDSMEKATKKAIRYLSQYGWEVLEVQSCLPMQPEQILRLDRQKEFQNYRNAEQYGICAQLHAWPENPAPGFYSAEPLYRPPKK